MTKQATLGLALTCLVIAALTLPIVEWLTAFFAWVQACTQAKKAVNHSTMGKVRAAMTRQVNARPSVACFVIK